MENIIFSSKNIPDIQFNGPFYSLKSSFQTNMGQNQIFTRDQSKDTFKHIDAQTFHWLNLIQINLIDNDSYRIRYLCRKDLIDQLCNVKSRFQEQFDLKIRALFDPDGSGDTSYEELFRVNVYLFGTDYQSTLLTRKIYRGIINQTNIIQLYKSEIKITMVIELFKKQLTIMIKIVQQLEDDQ